jgi:hypothetical protein
MFSSLQINVELPLKSLLRLLFSYKIEFSFVLPNPVKLLKPNPVAELSVNLYIQWLLKEFLDDYK